MTETAERYLKGLEQLLPFLVAAPGWFRIWIYALIALNLATLAAATIFYLSFKQDEASRRSLASLSIESPRPGEEISLGETRSTLLSGRLPAIEDPQLAASTRIDVTVRRLPAGTIVPQSGEPILSTVRGWWSYKYVQLPGEGDYQITVASHIGAHSDFQEVQIKALPTLEVLRHRIGRERKERNAASVAALAPDLGDLRQVQQTLDGLQAEFLRLFFDENNVPDAARTLDTWFDLVDPALLRYPDDLYLQNMRAYAAKNRAMLLTGADQTDTRAKALDEAEHMFKSVFAQNPRDAGALNGLGSVALMRGDPQQALYYIDQALKIAPDYREAKEDRATAERVLREQKGGARKARP